MMKWKIGLKADFHSAENIARSTFPAHFLLNCSNQIQISEHISKESEREKSIARHFPLNGNPPLVSKAGFPLGEFARANKQKANVVMSSVFVTSQSSCFFLCSREQIRLVENRLNDVIEQRHIHLYSKVFLKHAVVYDLI